jgi:hypothetical protein
LSTNMGKTEDAEVILGVVGFILLLGVLIAYYGVVTENFKHLRESVSLTVINITRTAQFLPTYAIIMCLSVWMPDFFLPGQVLVAIAEGYSFFCFFSTIVNYLGGPTKVIDIMQNKFDSGRQLIFPCCCPTDAKAVYERTLGALYHFIITRTVFVCIWLIFQLIMKYSDLTEQQHTSLYVIAIILQIITLSFLVNGFGSLVSFFEVLRQELGNLWGIPKMVLLKFCVGLIVIQGLIEQFLVSSKSVDVQSSSNFSAEDRGQMIYCFLVVTEYFLLSYIYYWAYSKDITPLGVPSLHDDDDEGGDADIDKPRQSADDSHVDVTFSEFIQKVLDPRDVWRNLDPAGEGLKTPLTQADANSA